MHLFMKLVPPFVKEKALIFYIVFEDIFIRKLLATYFMWKKNKVAFLFKV